MAKNKTLTIYNSDRYFNIATKDKETINNSIKVTRLNEQEIENKMDDIKIKSGRYKIKDNNRYMFFNEKYNNDKLIEKVCNYAEGVFYYTDSVVPYYVFKQLSNKEDSAVIYRMREKFTDKEIDNIALSFMGTKVIIDISVVLPSVNPYEIIRNLHAVKTNVDEVHLTFPYLATINEQQKDFYELKNGKYYLKPEYQVDFAERLRVSLSVWKMYIYILVDEEEKDNIILHINKIKKSKKVKL